MGNGTMIDELMTVDDLEELAEILDFADSRAVIIQGLRASFAMKRPIRCSEWCDLHFYLSSESSDISGPFKCWGFQRAPLDLWGSGLIKRCDWLKSSRVGFTKCELGFIAYCIAHSRMNPLSIHPNDTKADEFAKQHIEPMIDDCPAVSSLFNTAQAGKLKRNSDNTFKTKRFTSGVILDIRGGKSPNNYRSLTKDVVIYDELDGFGINIGFEGDPVALGDKRVKASPFGFSLRGTTPTMESRSLIKKAMMGASLRFRYHLPCPHCGSLEPLEWNIDDKEKGHGITWTGDEIDSVRNVCKQCGSEWGYGLVGQLNEIGQWRTDEGWWIDPVDSYRLVDPEGNDAKWPEHIAFFLWAALLAPHALARDREGISRYPGGFGEADDL